MGPVMAIIAKMATELYAHPATLRLKRPCTNISNKYPRELHLEHFTRSPQIDGKGYTNPPSPRSTYTLFVNFQGNNSARVHCSCSQDWFPKVARVPKLLIVSLLCLGGVERCLQVEGVIRRGVHPEW